MIKFNSEHDLEMMLYNHHEETQMCLVSDQEYDHCFRQVDAGGYGICDLIYITKWHGQDCPDTISIHVVELKNEGIKLKDIAQICRYRTFFEKVIELKFSELDMVINIEYSLVVPSGILKNQDACYMVNTLIDVIDIVEFDLDPITGIKFKKSQGFTSANENLLALDQVLEVI